MIEKTATLGALHQLAGMALDSTWVPAKLMPVSAGHGRLAGSGPVRAALSSSVKYLRCGMAPGASQAAGRSGPDSRLPRTDSPSTDCRWGGRVIGASGKLARLALGVAR